jgi:hypothetical protein
MKRSNRMNRSVLRSAVSGITCLGPLGLIAAIATAMAQSPNQTVNRTPDGAAVHLRLAVQNPRSASCVDAGSLSRRVEFAGLREAQHILGHRDEWARQLSEFDLGVRQRTASPAGLDAFLAYAAMSGRTWTPDEEAGWQALVDKLSDALAGLNLHLPKIDLVKTSGAEEFNAAYTRARAIMLPESRTSAPAANARAAFFLLAHETFHLLTRQDPRLRDELYALLGFERIKRFQYPAELEERRLSNPDAFDYLHTLTVKSGSESVDVLPINQSLLSLAEAIQNPNPLAGLQIVLLGIDRSTGEVRRDADGNLLKLNFGNTNWVPLMRRNSSYIIHPEEVLADNFATLMEWRLDGVLPVTTPAGVPINDVSLLLAIEDVLAGGCRQ